MVIFRFVRELISRKLMIYSSQEITIYMHSICDVNKGHIYIYLLYHRIDTLQISATIENK